MVGEQYLQFGNTFPLRLGLGFPGGKRAPDGNPRGSHLLRVFTGKGALREMDKYPDMEVKKTSTEKATGIFRRTGMQTKLS